MTIILTNTRPRSYFQRGDRRSRVSGRAGMPSSAQRAAVATKNLIRAGAHLTIG